MPGSRFAGYLLVFDQNDQLVTFKYLEDVSGESCTSEHTWASLAYQLLWHFGNEETALEEAVNATFATTWEMPEQPDGGLPEVNGETLELNDPATLIALRAHLIEALKEQEKTSVPVTS
jgi:hypothetical protein